MPLIIVIQKYGNPKIDDQLASIKPFRGGVNEKHSKNPRLHKTIEYEGNFPDLQKSDGVTEIVIDDQAANLNRAGKKQEDDFDYSCEGESDDAESVYQLTDEGRQDGSNQQPEHKNQEISTPSSNSDGNGSQLFKIRNQMENDDVNVVYHGKSKGTTDQTKGTKKSDRSNINTGLELYNQEKVQNNMDSVDIDKNSIGCAEVTSKDE